jgi:hypothetical protein
MDLATTLAEIAADRTIPWAEIKAQAIARVRR